LRAKASTKTGAPVNRARQALHSELSIGCTERERERERERTREKTERESESSRARQAEALRPTPAEPSPSLSVSECLGFASAANRQETKGAPSFANRLQGPCWVASPIEVNRLRDPSGGTGDGQPARAMVDSTSQSVSVTGQCPNKVRLVSRNGMTGQQSISCMVQVSGFRVQGWGRGPSDDSKVDMLGSWYKSFRWERAWANQIGDPKSLGQSSNLAPHRRGALYDPSLARHGDLLPGETPSAVSRKWSTSI
jgi:hypothetical protein